VLPALAGGQRPLAARGGHPRDAARPGHVHQYWAGPNGEDTYEATQFDLDYSQWHVYGLEWTPDRLTLTIDGKEIKTYTSNIPNEPMTVGLQGHVGAPGDWYGNPNGSGVNHLDIAVDYVRVYEYSPMG
jgi:beta-glucanase (GH16 family)